MGITIKKAEPADMAAVLSLFEKVVDTLPPDPFDPNNPCGWVKGVYPMPRDILPDISEGRMIIAKNDDGSVIGTVSLNFEVPPEYETVPWHYKRPGERYIVVHRLAVSPERRGSGIASAVIREAEAEARRLGYTTVRLDTLTKNTPAQRVYESLGYIRVCDMELGYEDTSGFLFRLYDKDITE